MQVLASYAKDINMNGDIMTMYVNHLLPGITRDDDDGNYGSSACYDVLCLQALSKRIHYGALPTPFRRGPLMSSSRVNWVILLCLHQKLQGIHLSTRLRRSADPTCCKP